ncbi:MAG: hypothetical protein LBE79_02405 [Tannerella sp.]|jgi:C-terminal processing protease CtpA/Prc|nr:hypothetical protein [Tannerella sp.]
MNRKYLKWFGMFLACAGLLFFSCGQDPEIDPAPDPGENETPVSEKTLKVNQFIFDDVKNYYLWTSTINWSAVNPKNETNSFTFFEKMIYRDDSWSMLTDDAEGFHHILDGVATTFGYELIWGRFINSTARYAIVLYVYPGSPAEKAGLKRGDFLVSIDGRKDITDSNYMDLYQAPSITLGKATLGENGYLIPDNQLVSMNAVWMYEDPVVKDTVIVKGSHKIGYLCYTNYTEESEKRLQEVFAGFKRQGVTDVVLDLRYNGGGYARTSCLLSSILAPAHAVKQKDIFLTQTWNAIMMAYFKQTKEDTNEYFTDTISINMDLSRLFVLTLRFTASASESTMLGLKPYMDVIQIGEPTHGKYYAGALISPMVFDSRRNTWIPDKEIENWLLYLMVYRYADRNGDTSFSGGLEPDYFAQEDYGYVLPQLGDVRDPLFGKAVEMITGESVRTRSASSLPHPHPIDSVLLRSPLNGKLIFSR